MKNPIPFNLNEGIRRWRQNLSASPALAADSVEELETHLRASVVTLTAQGLSEEEAFLIALRRLGDTAQLSHEFSKVAESSGGGSRVEPWMDAGLFGLGFWLAHFVRYHKEAFQWWPPHWRPADFLALSHKTNLLGMYDAFTARPYARDQIAPFFTDYFLPFLLVIPLARLVMGGWGWTRPPLLGERRRRLWWLAKSCALVFAGLTVQAFLLQWPVAGSVFVLFPFFSFVLVWLKDELLRRCLPRQKLDAGAIVQ